MEKNLYSRQIFMAQHSRNQTPKRIHHKDTKSPRRRNMLTPDFTDYTDFGEEETETATEIHDFEIE
jgi:hypothetical protein